MFVEFSRIAVMPHCGSFDTADGVPVSTWPAWLRRWKRPVKAAAFRQWVQQIRWQQEMRARLRKAVVRMQRVKLGAAFTAWAQHTTDVHAHASSTQIDALQVRTAFVTGKSPVILPTRGMTVAGGGCDSQFV